jgi:hypothetical protein
MKAYCIWHSSAKKPVVFSIEIVYLTLPDNLCHISLHSGLLQDRKKDKSPEGSGDIVRPVVDVLLRYCLRSSVKIGLKGLQ